MLWQQMRAPLSKEGTLIFFFLSFSQLCVRARVCAPRMPVPTPGIFFRTKESPSLPSAPQIWSDGKPLTPAGQGRFRMVQEKRERSYGVSFLHLFTRDGMHQRELHKCLGAKGWKEGKTLGGELELDDTRAQQVRSERRATEGVLRLGMLANPHTPFYAETKSHRTDSGVDTNMYMEAHRKLQT